MDEAKWRNSTNLKSLTDYLAREQVTSHRKLRLFAVACCRRVEHLLTHEASRKALAAVERFADGLVKLGTLTRYCREAYDPYEISTQAGRPAHAQAALSVRDAGIPSGLTFLQTPQPVALALVYEAGHTYGKPAFQKAREKHLAEMIALLHDVVPNPFTSLPVADPAWLEANGGLVARLAQSIYDERRFTELPILADALEDAGCTEVAILEHLRGSGPHARGCWPLDLLLGKE